MQPLASLCCGLCDCIYACVANHAVPVWRIMPVRACLKGRSSLRSRLCDYIGGRRCAYMHTSVTDYADVFMPVWEV